MLLDLSKAYDRVPLAVAARAARDRGFPPFLLHPALAMYASHKWVRLNGAVAPARARSADSRISAIESASQRPDPTSTSVPTNLCATG